MKIRIVSLLCLSIAVLPFLVSGGCSKEAATRGAEQVYSWPRWGGPDGNWVSRETGWNPAALNVDAPVAWTVDIGDGYSNVAIQGGRLYTMGADSTTQTVTCLNAATGKVIWKNTRALLAKPPQSTPAIDGDSLYTLNSDGLVSCLSTRNGKVLWSKHLVKDLGMLQPSYGFAGSPVVTDTFLVVACNGYGLALAKANGNLVWKSPSTDPNDQHNLLDNTYATPVLFTKDNLQHLLQLNGFGLYSIKVETGTPDWFLRYPNADFVENIWYNIVDPVFFDGQVFISSAYGMGCTLLDVSTGQPYTVWQNANLCADVAPCLLVDGYLYGCHDAVLFKNKTSRNIAGVLRCLDAVSGALRWEKDLGQAVSLTSADGKLLVLSDQGILTIAEADPTAFRPIASCEVLPPDKGMRAFCTPPVLCNGRIYCRNYAGELVCLDVRG